MLFTPSDFGSHTLQFSLSIEYDGRKYTEPSSSIAISTMPSVSPPVSIVATAVEPKPASVAPPPAVPAPAVTTKVLVTTGVAAPSPAPQPQAQPQAAFPWLVVAVLVAVAVPIAAAVAYFLTRPKPYGYIYTESDDELVDFANLERRPIFRFFYRGLIRGSELNIPGLEGLVFHFMKDRIDVKSFDENVNRQGEQPTADRLRNHQRQDVDRHGREAVHVPQFTASRRTGRGGLKSSREDPLNNREGAGWTTLPPSAVHGELLRKCLLLGDDDALDHVPFIGGRGGIALPNAVDHVHTADYLTEHGVTGDAGLVARFGRPVEVQAVETMLL